jgi:choline-phosphate cytidylyltransferase
MTKVITYGTYDLLHYGHISLLERAKALGDYLIVGVTSDGFDKIRGKINVQQSLMERVAAVRETGIADEIIVEEYEGQKIDDIKRYDIDIFAIGSDWDGYFDYLNEFCKVVYLDRTQGISSTEIRSKNMEISLGLVGELESIDKYENECRFVNGIKVSAVCSDSDKILEKKRNRYACVTNNFDELLNVVDAVYLCSHPSRHYEQIKKALLAGKHVLCESPIVMRRDEMKELSALADKQGCILMNSIKTAYSTAYARLNLITKDGRIGKIVSVDATCTSLRDGIPETSEEAYASWSSICEWGPFALLPVFQILGTEYEKKHITSHIANVNHKYDTFTKIDFVYKDSVATVKIGKGVKSEGELVVSGTKGYIYVPAPWWKTDYFEVRYENIENNKKYFYQLDGEGIRYEMAIFLRSIHKGKSVASIDYEVSQGIVGVIEDFMNGVDVTYLD